MNRIAKYLIPSTIGIFILQLPTGKAASGEFGSDAYIKLSANEKMNKLWTEITKDRKIGQWHLTNILFESMEPTFDTKGDEMPCYWNGCRYKAIHSVGTIAKVKFIPLNNNSPYSGIFKGADYGLIRLSAAI